MFTGIVDHMGAVVAINPSANMLQLDIETEFTDLTVGESIAVNGTCLTVIATEGQRFRADVSSETFSRTTLGSLQPEQRVNLERALQVGDRLGGHWVSGHVDQTARVRAITAHDACVALEITGISDNASKWLIEKGSITLNGVSLTVNATIHPSIILMLIPETLSRTNLGVLDVGDHVNVEFDMLGKYVARHVNLTQNIPHTLPIGE